MVRVADINRTHDRQPSLPFERPQQALEARPVRRRHRKGRIRTILKRIFAVSVFIAIQLLVYAWYQGYTDRWLNDAENWVIALSVDAGYALEQVRTEGEMKTPDSDILKALAVNPGDALFGLDMAALSKRVEALPWVKHAVVTRELPSTIRVWVEERVPFARWQIEGAVVVVDDTATVIKGAKSADYPQLPFVVGKDAPERAPGLFKMLSSNPELSNHVVAAVRVGDRRWDLEFDNGMRLKLPEPSEAYGEADAWRAFAAMDRDKHIMAMDVAVFDLRLPDRVVMRLTPEGQKEFDKKDPGT